MKKVLLAAAVLFFSTSIAKAEVLAGFGMGVQNKALTNKIDTLDKTQAQNVFFHTEILNQQGDIITHVWKNGDKEIYRKSFQVNGPRWRVWSSMVPDHFTAGDTLSVEVQDQTGKNLYVGNLGVAEANAPKADEGEVNVDVSGSDAPQVEYADEAGMIAESSNSTEDIDGNE
ncbi:MAG: DUF2914 domain-containing protein [Alphaproteobacteria bacterium]|nr:DUF2914 domain-containing protein [Alphaproteobacteria bacterium]